MRIFMIFLLCMAFMSCTTNYNSPISGRQISQQGNFRPMNDSLTNLLSQGLIFVDASHAGNPEIFDSVYVVKLTAFQNGENIKHTAWRLWGIIIGAALILGFLFLFIKITSAGNAKSPGSTTPMGLLIPVAVGCVLLGVCIYPFSSEREILKKDYLSYKGDLQTFWTLPAKTY